jgi:hypothetical protein
MGTTIGCSHFRKKLKLKSKGTSVIKLKLKRKGTSLDNNLIIPYCPKI